MNLNISYRLKLIFVITGLSVSLTAACMFMFYNYTYNSIMSSLSKNLMDVAKVIRVSLTDEDIDRIERLEAMLSPYVSYTQSEIEEMNNGGVLNNLSEEVIYRLQSTEDFQELLLKMKRLAMATLHEGAKKEPVFDEKKYLDYTSKGVLVPYLVYLDQKYIDCLIVQNLVSPAYMPSDGWPGNPIGTSWRTPVPKELGLKYDTYVHDRLHADKFYTMLFSSTPIYRKNGELLGFILLEYPAGIELDKLVNLRILSYVIIAASFILSFIISFYTSKRMSSSLKKLSDAATEIKNNNYDVTVKISDKDEFGNLGNVFNRMAAAVKSTTSELRDSNERLMSLTADMHDGVGAVLTSIQIAARNDGDMDNIRTLAEHGMGEIRFLMDAMEYSSADFELLCDGISLLAVDILKPNGINCELKTEGENREIPFQLYLDIQRVAREAFTNVIKHSDSKSCIISVCIGSDIIKFSIFSEGNPLEKCLVTSGRRGLKNMQFRTERYGGAFSAEQIDGGFELKADFMSRPC